MQTTQLKVEQLAFERNEQNLFENISFSLNLGQSLQIQGANGSGKSTLLRVLSGLLEPSHGFIFWKNKSISEYSDTYRAEINYLGHQNSLRPHLTVFENLQLGQALMGNATINIDEILQQVELDHVAHQQALHLSAGQARRAGVARLLINPASIWFLDEPTTALDQRGQALVTKIMNQHLEKNGIVILATHQNIDLHHKKILELGVQYA